jgi:DNA polymerase V
LLRSGANVVSKISSRYFGEHITALEYLTEAVKSYTARACAKLRTESMSAKQITIFCRTSPFADNEPYYSNSASSELSCPSDNTRDFLPIASRLIGQIFKPNYCYAKAGIMLSDFYAPSTFQLSLFDDQPQDTPQTKALMETIDQLNRKHRNTVYFASEGVTKPWAMKRGKMLPQYTTRWGELPLVS